MESPLCEEKSTTLILNLDCAKVKTRKDKTDESSTFIVPCTRLQQTFDYGKNLHKLSTFHKCGNSTPSSSLRQKALFITLLMTM
jgi:hypothetical protein